jgi:glucose/arabinose dehydrogenase
MRHGLLRAYTVLTGPRSRPVAVPLHSSSDMKVLISSWSRGSVLLLAFLASACPSEEAPGVVCAEDNGSLELPDGFCATVFADEVGRARHIAVTPSGDVYIAISNEFGSDSPGGIMALRDEDGDGVADRRERFAEGGGNGITWRDGMLYLAQDDRILRYRLPDGTLLPSGSPDVIVSGLPGVGGHIFKSVEVDDDGNLFVNIGSPSNACQVDDRQLESPGLDPCPELATRAGIWRFDADTIGQTQADGERYATGIRNANALAFDPQGTLWAAQNGRDQLYENWPQLYTPEDEQRLPSEEIFRITEGADYGWPYCYHDAALDQKVLAPEYGGNGTIIGRCAAVEEPDAVLPAHWAPLSMDFYEGNQFPARYRGGMFIANHGSWHDPSAVQPPGYNVVFIPVSNGEVLGGYERFAEDFAGEGRPLPEQAEHRPVGVTEAPDGSLYISDDWGGRVWRVYYRGNR